MRKAFTLIELIISIAILSILMLFLYKSYSMLNRSNTLISKEISTLKKFELIKKIVYMDFTLSLSKSTKVLNQERDEDVVFLQTSNSIHDRVNPYVAYIVKNKKLYRLESLKPFKEYPLTSDAEYEADELGEIKSFRTYASSNKSLSLYLVHIVFKDKREILLKIKAFNS